jgi:aminopeptidase-like protein
MLMDWIFFRVSRRSSHLHGAVQAMLRSTSLLEEFDATTIGRKVFALAADIFPICRSITGNGVRETLRHLSRHIALETHEVPSGTSAFDWTVPKEWNIKDAFIKNAAGERVVDFRASNLHVVSYSAPIHGFFRLDELKNHIFTLPDQPDLVPYRTSYYKESWGFCMAHNRLQALPDGIYEVSIDSSIEDGSMTYGEFFHRGETTEEILFSAHICHPSLANDNCSGLALLTYLAKHLGKLRTHYSYRFIFAPGTIGAIVWLSRNERIVSRIRHGMVVSCLGDPGGPTYKRTRRGDTTIDRAMTHVLGHAAASPQIVAFSPFGYDERQYCSPGFNLPVGLFQRSRYATFPEYHTSGDNLDFIKPEHLAASYRMIAELVEVLENDTYMRNVLPKCEPQLGRRGLYSPVGGSMDAAEQAMSLLWVLNMSDEKHSLLDIAERSGLSFAVVHQAARRLEQHELLTTATTSCSPIGGAL